MLRRAEAAALPAPAGSHKVRIQPSRGWVALRLGDLWEYRELVYFLVWRDIKARYKQTAFGAGWAILQPVLTMVVFSVFFGRLAKLPSDGVPYPVFSLCALVPWTYFANSLMQSSNSLVANTGLIKKVYFPRLAMPVAAVLGGLVDLGLAFSVLLGMMLFYGTRLSWNILWLPLFVLLALVTALGVGMWLSTLNVQYRDVRYVVPFLTQVWLFATPVAYSSSLLAEPWRTLYGLNPMVGVVDGFRWALLGVRTPPGPVIGVSAVVALAVLLTGAAYLRRMERTFADVA